MRGSRFVTARLGLCSALVVAGVSLTTTSLATQAAASAAHPSSAVKVPEYTLPLARVGHINLTTLSQAARSQNASVGRSSTATNRYREVDNSIAVHAPKGKASTAPNPKTTALTTKNVPGESGFSALGRRPASRHHGREDLEPPDQGLCAGGGYVMEFINNAFAIYSSSGAQLVAPVGSASAFLQPTTDFFSDPRCYYDAPTKHWFFQEFIVGAFNASGKLITPSTEFEAVSNTADPTDDLHDLLVEHERRLHLGLPVLRRLRRVRRGRQRHLRRHRRVRHRLARIQRGDHVRHLQGAARDRRGYRHPAAGLRLPADEGPLRPALHRGSDEHAAGGQVRPQHRVFRRVQLQPEQRQPPVGLRLATTRRCWAHRPHRAVPN